MQVSELLLWGAWTDYMPPVLNVLIIIVGLFLMLVVLIQRGKGGGLAGAFGGAGGSSAFGSRAGDQFVWVTLATAGVWVLLIMLMVKFMPHRITQQQQPPPQQQQQTHLGFPVRDL